MNEIEQRHRGIMIAICAAVVSGFAVFVNGLAVQRFEGEVTYHNGQRFPMRGWRRGLR